MSFLLLLLQLALLHEVDESRLVVGRTRFLHILVVLSFRLEGEVECLDHGVPENGENEGKDGIEGDRERVG